MKEVLVCCKLVRDHYRLIVVLYRQLYMSGRACEGILLITGKKGVILNKPEL